VRTVDVMADAARIFGEVAEARASESLGSEILELLGGDKQPFVLARINLDANTDDPACLEAILRALDQARLPVLLPLHPRTRDRIADHRFERLLEPLTLSDPLGFLAMVLLELRSALVVSDSGGVQKEAFLQGTPSVTVRRETEWFEPFAGLGQEEPITPWQGRTLSQRISAREPAKYQCGVCPDAKPSRSSGGELARPATCRSDLASQRGGVGTELQHCHSSGRSEAQWVGGEFELLLQALGRGRVAPRDALTDHKAAHHAARRKSGGPHPFRWMPVKDPRV